MLIYIYGHLNRIRSSKMLERECIQNLYLWWLLGRLTPDHNTIADIQKDNLEPLLKVFRLFIQLSREIRMIKGERLCVDGTPWINTISK